MSVISSSVSEVIDLNGDEGSSNQQEPNGNDNNNSSESNINVLHTCEQSNSEKRKSPSSSDDFHYSTKRQKKGHFSIDCLHVICEYLPPKKLATIMLVCKDWDDLLKTNHYFWYTLYKRMFFEDLNIKRENISEYDFMTAFKTRYAFVLKYSVGSSLSKFLIDQDSLVEKAFRSESNEDALGFLSKCVASQNVLKRHFELQQKQVDVSISALKFLQELEDIKEGTNTAKYLITIFLQRSIDLTDDDSDDEMAETNFSKHDISVLDCTINQFTRFTKSRNSIIVTNCLNFGTPEESSQKLDFVIISSLGHYIAFNADIETRVLDETYLDSGRVKVFGKVFGEQINQFLFEVIFDGESERTKYNFNHEFTNRCLKELGLIDINPRTFLYFICRLISTDIDPQFLLRIQIGIVNYNLNNSSKPNERVGEDAYVQNLSDEEEEEEEGEETLTEEERRFVVNTSDEEEEPLEDEEEEEEITILSSGDEMSDEDEDLIGEPPSSPKRERKVIEDEEDTEGNFSPTIDLNETPNESDPKIEVSTIEDEDGGDGEGKSSDQPVDLDFDDE